MKRRTIKLIGLLTLMVISGGLIARAVLGGDAAQAVLEYQDDVDVHFTFNPAIGVSLSANSIEISKLAVGTSSNSEKVDVIVRTNNLYGYTLTATVGDSSHAYRDLTNVVSGTTYRISSIAFSNVGVNTLGLDASGNGTWGYSLDGGATYYGLPLYTDESNVATLASSNDMPARGEARVPFWIGASASAAQAAGAYTNVINFLAVANPESVSQGD